MANSPPQVPERSLTKTVVKRAHSKFVHSRRAKVLADELAKLVVGCERLLDVGTGDGQIARMLLDRNGVGTIEGIDVFVRPQAHIPVKVFDGRSIPHRDNDFDAVTLVDVLHHTHDPLGVLREAARVSRRFVVIKDHLAEGWFDHATLRFMDWVGNAPHGVALPYNYAPRTDWMRWFEEAGLELEEFRTDIALYPWPFSAVFGRSLHFVARLRVRDER